MNLTLIIGIRVDASTEKSIFPENSQKCPKSLMTPEKPNWDFQRKNWNMKSEILKCIALMAKWSLEAVGYNWKLQILFRHHWNRSWCQYVEVNFSRKLPKMPKITDDLRWAKLGFFEKNWSSKPEILKCTTLMAKWSLGAFRYTWKLKFMCRHHRHRSWSQYGKVNFSRKLPKNTQNHSWPRMGRTVIFRGKIGIWSPKF